MPRKRKSDDTSQQPSKKQREQPIAAAAAAPSSAAARACHAAALAGHAQHRRLQNEQCCKLSSLISTSASRPLQQSAADVAQLLQEDSQREQSLIDLTLEQSVSTSTLCLYDPTDG
jgi:mevalonate pyrophosphate decarboxylase